MRTAVRKALRHDRGYLGNGHTRNPAETSGAEVPTAFILISGFLQSGKRLTQAGRSSMGEKMMLTVPEVLTVHRFLVSLDFCTRVCATGKSAKLPLESVPLGTVCDLHSPWLTCPSSASSSSLHVLQPLLGPSAPFSKFLLTIHPPPLRLPPSIPIMSLGKEALLQSESIAADFTQRQVFKVISTENVLMFPWPRPYIDLDQNAV